MLNINDYDYFTFSFFECKINKLESLLEHTLVRDNFKLTKQLTLDFNLYEKTPPKGGKHLSQAYFFTPKVNANLTIMLSNHADGWQTLVNFLCSNLTINAYSFHITNNINIPEPYNAFRVISAGKDIRTVYALFENKWIFFATGEKQWFEDEKNYQRRTIKHRLDKDILTNYCLKLGIDLNNNFLWENEKEVLFLEKLSN